MLERVLAARLREHLSHEGPDLVDCQFGFREGRSTVNAIRRVRALSYEAVSRGRVVLAVSLDIANAFNTFPWKCIRQAFRFHRVPTYMQEVIGDYLWDRGICYLGRYGVAHNVESSEVSRRDRSLDRFCGTSAITGFSGAPSFEGWV
ncbi:uncharacterized protein LOC120359336 [Solenopsis invicta]|uniref:uncharacterized protein LOC120359336 n=1 Tax=Solenopsis invicta TaxID=13686 RepID=UPI00193DA05D|nr:uncharacterized protein LOC120359336 [Solenopsis invicta]